MYLSLQDDNSGGNGLRRSARTRNKAVTSLLEEMEEEEANDDAGTEGLQETIRNLKKQLDQEAVCDVYQVAKLAHNKRPGIWRSKDDYLFIYQALESLTQVRFFKNL